MRKIEEQTVFAFLARAHVSARNSNTCGGIYYLHDNRIAQRVEGGVLLSTAGWETKTTGSRLRAIVAAMGRTDVRVRSKDYSLGLEFLDADGRMIRREELHTQPTFLAMPNDGYRGTASDGSLTQWADPVTA